MLQVAEQALVEPGAHLAGVDELPVFVEAHESAPIDAPPSDDSVKPPITTSWVSRHFAFRQSPPRPSR